MLELIAANMTVVWLALMVLLLIVEALTAPLVCIWFALGALAALISALFGAADIRAAARALRERAEQAADPSAGGLRQKSV